LDFKTMVLVEVKTQSQKDIVKKIIENYHSYVPHNASVGRRIDWLIYEEDSFPSQPVGMIGIGSSVYPPPKDLLNKLQLSKLEYREVFNTICNNWRFCMVKSIKNAGTRVLKELRKKGPIAWKQKYGDELKHIITFVAGGNTGAVYKADNWQSIGFTAGLPEHKSSSMKWDNSEELSKKFVKPTGENRKIIFYKCLDN